MNNLIIFFLEIIEYLFSWVPESCVEKTKDLINRKNKKNDPSKKYEEKENGQETNRGLKGDSANKTINTREEDI